jgi:hypothetical protein
MTMPDDFKSRPKITLWDMLDPLLRAVLALSAVLLVCIFIGLLGFIAGS